MASTEENRILSCLRFEMKKVYCVVLEEFDQSSVVRSDLKNDDEKGRNIREERMGSTQKK
jgi:hypothetical protein